MPKYLISASYTADGIKGVMKDGGTKRRQAAETVFGSVGGRVDAFYFTFGDQDVVAVVDMPDHVSMAAVSMTIGASGLIQGKTIVLLTPEEVDQAVKKSTSYTPPGR